MILWFYDSDSMILWFYESVILRLDDSTKGSPSNFCWWTTDGSGNCSIYFTPHPPPAATDHWSELAKYFTPQWLRAAICFREFRKQLEAVKMDKSKPLDACQNPHSASGSLRCAHAHLADLPETLPLIPFTIWESLLYQHKICTHLLKKHTLDPQENAFETKYVCSLLHPHEHLYLFLGVMFSVVYSALGAV